MRIIAVKTLKAFWQRHPDAQTALRQWYNMTGQAEWANVAQVRQTFGNADPVSVCHGNPVVVFNIGGNKYRLITAIHYNTQVVYAMMVLTHKEYDKNKWKAQLC